MLNDIPDMVQEYFEEMDLRVEEIEHCGKPYQKLVKTVPSPDKPNSPVIAKKKLSPLPLSPKMVQKSPIAPVVGFHNYDSDDSSALQSKEQSSEANTYKANTPHRKKKDGRGRPRKDAMPSNSDDLQNCTFCENQYQSITA